VLVAEDEPALFVALTVTLTSCPTSEAGSVSVDPVVPSDHAYV
jgi:hypothetical protein